jgi:hypothetical protein
MIQGLATGFKAHLVNFLSTLGSKKATQDHGRQPYRGASDARGVVSYDVVIGGIIARSRLG